ncbi:MAG: LbtU family siderophore porin [Gammaproteobacteria bacterium]|nr:LbtU family siderophore porin [Gammaproteobacteria bacterium]
MKLKPIALALICTGIMTQPVLADDMSELRAQLKAMQEQMQMMQKKLDAQDVVLKKQEKTTSEIKHQQANRRKDSDARAVAHQVADSLSVGGVIEVVANNTDSDGWSGENASDIVLDTFELSLEASAGEWVSGNVLFLYEDADDDNLNVDEAFITIANSEVTPFYLSAGRLYVPFGNFETNMISDPATLTLGETREDVAQVGFESEGGFYGSAYVFNGDADEAKGNYTSLDNNTIDNYGLNFGYAMENDNFNLDVGAGYINNIATSDTLQDAVGEIGRCAGDGCLDDYVGGLSLHAIATIGSFNLIGEYVTAMDDFEANELSSISSKKLKPKAWNIEGAYNFEMAGKETTVALGYQKTKDMYLDSETTDFFEKAWLASISVGILENTTIAAEWRHADGYSEVKNVVGNDFEDEDLLQVKLSYQF